MHFTRRLRSPAWPLRSTWLGHVDPPQAACCDLPQLSMHRLQVLAEVAGEDMAAMAKARVPRHQQVVEEEPEEAAPSEAEQDLQARLNAVRG